MAGIFASTELGLFSGQGFADGINSMGEQLSVQLTGIIAVALYTAVATYIILKLIDIVCGLRVTEEEETEGLDIALHNESGYDL